MPGGGISFGTKFTRKCFDMCLGVGHQIVFHGKTHGANITYVGSILSVHSLDVLLQIIGSSGKSLFAFLTFDCVGLW